MANYENSALVRWARSELHETSLGASVCSMEDLGRFPVLIELTSIALQKCQLEVDVRSVSPFPPPATCRSEFLFFLSLFFFLLLSVFSPDQSHGGRTR